MSSGDQLSPDYDRIHLLEREAEDLRRQLRAAQEQRDDAMADADELRTQLESAHETLRRVLEFYRSFDTYGLQQLISDVRGEVHSP